MFYFLTLYFLFLPDVSISSGVFEVVRAHFPLYTSGTAILSSIKLFFLVRFSTALCLQQCHWNSVYWSRIQAFHCLTVFIQPSEEILPPNGGAVDHESLSAERRPLLSPLIPSDLELQWQDLLAIMEPQVSGNTGRLATSPYILLLHGFVEHRFWLVNYGILLFCYSEITDRCYE